MGNRALRKKLAEVFGSRTIYTGHKLASFKVLPANRLRRLIIDASVKPGDVIHDCTGFNRRVIEVKPEWAPVSYHSRGRPEGPRYIDGEFLRGIEIIFEGGNPRCECSSVEFAKSVADIEKWWFEWIQGMWASEHGWADSEFCKEVFRRLKAGEKICDEHGLCLPELDKLER
jgi:hypothetical protein